MSCLRIVGGNPLYGQVRVPAAKNAVLPILAACVLVQGEVLLEGCPHLSDIEAMASILRDLGATVRREQDILRVDTRGLDDYVCRDENCGCMRSSLFLLGSVLARCGRVQLGLPGGCVIGRRPIDIHLDGLAAFGVEVHAADVVLCKATDPHPCRYRLAYPSVGATLNLVFFALSVAGCSVLDNVAIEPEVTDTLLFLCRCGARIRWRGRRIWIEGGHALHGIRYRPVADRIVAATLACAVTLCGGELELRGVQMVHLRSLLDKIAQYSCICRAECDTIRLRSSGRPKAFCCTTAPYPGFATDMQALALAFNSLAWGQSIVRETVFESRFALVGQLQRMGADITLVGQCAILRGRPLVAAKVAACDLRAGAALVVAAVATQGTTMVSGVELIDRGYDAVETIFTSIGANVVRI